MSSSNNNNNNRENFKTLSGIFNTIRQKKGEQEIKLTEKILFSFIVVGIISKLIFTNINSGDLYGSNGPATVNIMSYSLILFSLVILVFASTIVQMHDNGSNPKTLDSIKGVSWDTLVIVIYLFWIISINLNYYKNINLKQVPPNFFLYSNLSHGIIAFQLIVFMINFVIRNSIRDIEDTGIKQRLNMLNYLLIFLNFFLIFIQQIILENFTVDVA